MPDQVCTYTHASFCYEKEAYARNELTALAWWRKGHSRHQWRHPFPHRVKPGSVPWERSPVSSSIWRMGLSDEMATKISILFYADAREALIKALGDEKLISDYGRMRAMLVMSV